MVLVRSRHVVQTYSIASGFLQPLCLPCAMAYGNLTPIEYVSTTFLVLPAQLHVHPLTLTSHSSEKATRIAPFTWDLRHIWDYNMKVLTFFFNHSIVFICLYFFTWISYFVVFQYRLIIYSLWFCLTASRPNIFSFNLN